MVVLPSGSPAYQASPGPPGPVRLSRASGRASRKDAVKKAMQRGRAITCRGRTPRANAEGHASAEPQTKLKMRFRTRVGSPRISTRAELLRDRRTVRKGKVR